MKLRLPPALARGFSLVEVTLALGLTTFCMTTLLALIPVGLRSSNESSSRAGALNMCTAIEAEFRANQGSIAASELFTALNLQIPAEGEAAREVTFYDTPEAPGFGASLHAASRYRFVVTLTPPTSLPTPAPAMAQMQVSWPAQAALQHSVGKAQMVIVLDTD